MLVLLPLMHRFSGQSGCHKWPPELSKSAIGSRCGVVSTLTQDAEFERSGEKSPPILANDPRRRSKATGWIAATICSVLEAGWKPGSPVFWQWPDAIITLGGALFNKAQIVDSVSTDMEIQLWKEAAGHSVSAGMEKGIITDSAKEVRNQLIKEENFTAVRALNFLVC